MPICPFCRKTVELHSVWCTCGANLSKYQNLPTSPDAVREWLAENEPELLQAASAGAATLMESARKRLIEEQENDIAVTTKKNAEINAVKKLFSDFLEECYRSGLAPTIDIGQLRKDRWRQWKRIPTEYRQHAPLKSFRLTPGYLFELALAKYTDEFCLSLDGTVYKHQLNAPDPFPIEELLKMATVAKIADSVTLSLVELLKMRQHPETENAAGREEASQPAGEGAPEAEPGKRGFKFWSRGKAEQPVVQVAEAAATANSEIQPSPLEQWAKPEAPAVPIPAETTEAEPIPTEPISAKAISAETILPETTTLAVTTPVQAPVAPEQAAEITAKIKPEPISHVEEPAIKEPVQPAADEDIPEPAPVMGPPKQDKPAAAQDIDRDRLKSVPSRVETNNNGAGKKAGLLGGLKLPFGLVPDKKEAGAPEQPGDVQAATPAPTAAEPKFRLPFSPGPVKKDRSEPPAAETKLPAGAKSVGKRPFNLGRKKAAGQETNTPKIKSATKLTFARTGIGISSRGSAGMGTPAPDQAPKAGKSAKLPFGKKKTEKPETETTSPPERAKTT